MALERKDVRFKCDPDGHAQLSFVAYDIDGLDIGEWVEALVMAEVKRRVHEARLIADRFPSVPISGSARE